MTRYKLWDYVANATPLPGEVPFGIDFTTGLVIKPVKFSTIVRGELIEEIHFGRVEIQQDGSPNYLEPLVRETWTYTRDPMTGLAVSREHKICWYDEFGVLDEEHPKVATKLYLTIAEKREEFVRKRSNIVSALLDIVVRSMVLSGMTVPQAVGVGSLFLKSIAGEQSLYVEGNADPLIAAVTNSTESWLNISRNGQTIRERILSEIS